ncbi:hypothetical protein KIL84_016167 [Mauremys mutica]|uniref:Uncharacterized protein n=1 Tax=Mauremys mutica TaxID=74926 RepID=A0A9D4ASP3_9SAUR|nr:hypothetical protein KIL84_016167 [Mauremys mutica]
MGLLRIMLPPKLQLLAVLTFGVAVLFLENQIQKLEESRGKLELPTIMMKEFSVVIRNTFGLQGLASRLIRSLVDMCPLEYAWQQLRPYSTVSGKKEFRIAQSFSRWRRSPSLNHIVVPKVDDETLG